MKSTSPLEGDFHTDELAGEEQEVEIPEWLAGYGEGEQPDEDPGTGTQADPVQQTEEDDYTWVSASSDTPKPAKTPIDLNTAAISQLEGILGISYQVARGVIRYREEHGPYRDIKDLLNVPEISDEQTIEILKPEVFIGEVEEAIPSPPEPKKTPKPKGTKPALDPDEMLSQARSELAESNIEEAIAAYDILIKKKKSLSDVIKDLEQAAIDHPIDIGIIKTLGDAYMKDNDLEKALEAYSKAEDLIH
jgi:competence ComEA-like helix-hairpin-helix protein